MTGEAEDEISDVILRKMGDIVNTKTNNLSKFPAYLVHEWLLQTGFPHNEYYVSGSAKAQMSCNCEPRD